MIDINNIKRLSKEEFRKFADLVYKESGIFLKDTKIALLSNRLRKRLRVLKLETFSEYYDYIQGLASKTKEIEELIDVVSTNETFFFRNERHFNSLAKFCFPKLAKAKAKEKRLRIWSAGCSTGEEPYTIGICVLENINLFKGWKIEIIATDIAPSVLEFAKKGAYTGRRIEKIPDFHLRKYFKQDKNDPELYYIKNEVKELVDFRYLNLFKSKYPEKMDLIFCRNVMIYFDREHQKKLVKGFHDVLLKHGYLFIGHSETLHTISKEFMYVKIGESPLYIPKEAADEL